MRHPSFRRQAFGSMAMAALMLGAGSCRGSKSNQSSAQTAPLASYTAQPYGGKMASDDGQWIRPAKDYASTRYSTLDQINTQTVKNLKVAWTFNTGTNRGQEAAPLVVNNTMYIVTPWPNLLYALDLTKPGGALKWKSLLSKLAFEQRR